MTKMKESKNRIFIIDDSPNVAYVSQRLVERKRDNTIQKHMDLQAEMANVDNLVHNYARKNNNEFVLECYRNYTKYPNVPKQTSLNSKELQAQIVYLKGLNRMMHRVKNDVQYQVMTSMLNEFRADMYALRVEKKYEDMSNVPGNVIYTGRIFHQLSAKDLEEEILISFSERAF